ncbi:MAG TPA: VOC family protein [Polyangiaceae bacterium]|nr:VOC family protein [Polyangiaceae bacterium]
MSTTTPQEVATAVAPIAEGLAAFRPRLSYLSYHVTNVERALGFYVGVLGMKEQARLALGNGLHEIVVGFADAPGASLILMWDEKRTEPYRLGDGYSRLIVRVSDVDGAMRELAKHDDIVVVKEATDAGSLRYSMVKDPDGYVVEFLQFKR